MNSNTVNMDRIIIIGTGMFGLSTVDHIRMRYPDTQLSVVSRPSHLAPSDDISKVVRIDYSNLERMEEAMVAQRQWMSNDIFTKVYRSIGRVVIYEQGDLATHHEINTTREELGLPKRQSSGSELMEEQFGTKTAPESLVYVLGSDDAIVDWEPCISQARVRARAACTDSGGRFYESGVASLVHDGSRVTAIILVNGERIDATTAQIVLAAGPWLAQVLTTSGITIPPSGRAPIATGLFSYDVQLSKEQAEYFRNRPMVTHNGKADFLPPASSHGTVGKITWIEPYTNLRGSALSCVEDLSESALAKSHMLKAIEWARVFLPALRGACITSITSYWDGVTETQVPLVARHPQLHNLVCAAGGSFNRAKDFPTIGSIIADALSGQPVPSRYSWDPEMKCSHRDQPRLVGRGDFAAMDEQAKGHAQRPVVDQSCLAVI